MSPSPDHTEALKKQMERIQQLTDEAWDALVEAKEQENGVHAAESKYSAWAALLLRYHDAVERVSEAAGVSPLKSMGA